MARLYRQAAVIPFRIRDERVETALVTTLRGKRWVVPRGSLADGERARNAATRATVEEAGWRSRKQAATTLRVAIKGTRSRSRSVLGDFNDAHLQERNLLDFGRAVAEADLEEPGALLTVGRLAENAGNRALSVRAEGDHELSRFCKDRSIRALFCRLFNRNTSIGDS